MLITPKWTASERVFLKPGSQGKDAVSDHLAAAGT